MQRRKFLKSVTGGVAGAGLAAPALAQAPGAVRWRMATSWPKSLDAMHGSAEALGKRVGQLTGGQFDIRVFAGGEIVPPFGVVDAVQNSTVECCHTAPYYFFGKDPTFAFACAIPFGMSARSGGLAIRLNLVPGRAGPNRCTVLLRQAGRQVAPVIPIGALARYDRPAPALDAYDELLTRSIP